MDAGQADIRIVDASAGRARRQFIRLPWRIYRNDPHWVAPLLIDQKKLFTRGRHPFHEHGRIRPFLAVRDGQAIGRVAAITNAQYNAFHGVNEGFWGFFECVDDADVARRLFDHVAGWFRERGVDTVWGPMNPSINHECGLLVDAFDSSPMVMMTYNPSYYVGLVESYGMTVARNLFAYRVTSDLQVPPKLAKLTERLRRRGDFTIRPFDLSRFESEVAQLRETFNEAWSGNWGFAPFTDAEFQQICRDMRDFAIPELCPVAERDGRLVAFMIAVPDINVALRHARGRLFPFGLLKVLWYKRKVDSLRVVVLGERPECASSGVTAGLYHDCISHGRRLGYRWAEMSWILEENVSVRRIIETFGGEIYKTYRVYRLPV